MTATASFTVPSEAGRLYTVAVFCDGAFACDCADHRYRGRDCKHIKQIQVQVRALQGLLRPVQRARTSEAGRDLATMLDF